MTQRDQMLTPPPGYDGSRFRKRSDGRDESFYAYPEITVREPIQKRASERHVIKRRVKDMSHPVNEQTNACGDECAPTAENAAPCDSAPECEREQPSALSAFFQSLGSEEILLIALILLLANDSRANIDTVLILALLLCVS